MLGGDGLRRSPPMRKADSLSSLTGLCSFCSHVPPINRWAIFFRPPGFYFYATIFTQLSSSEFMFVRDFRTDWRASGLKFDFSEDFCRWELLIAER